VNSSRCDGLDDRKILFANAAAGLKSLWTSCALAFASIGQDEVDTSANEKVDVIRHDDIAAQRDSALLVQRREFYQV
jgi:hypothetical protein